jgi:hypothetical protein
MSPLSQLAKLQKELQHGVEVLVSAMETQSEAEHVRLYANIADRCMRLERDINVLTKELLGAAPPHGMA